MKISLIFGTRPEAVKLCPLVRALQAHDAFSPHVCVTGQHRAMLEQVLDAFDVSPDVDLALMQPDQTLAEFSARAIRSIDAYLTAHKPDWVVVQGDTTTVFCAALAAYYRRIRVAHVEAGLRTGNKFSPFPEEANRVLATHLSDLHFAPTERARCNLLREGVADERIHVTGNTVIDALHIARDRVRREAPSVSALPADIQPGTNGKRVVLITGHRRESFGAGFESICTAIRSLATKHSDCAFVYPVHLNPNVREPVFRLLGDAANIHLTEPLDYLPFVAMMDRATLILTDSGGVQEEAPSLGKPVLVMRDTTERPEGVDAGTVKLVGTDADRIVSEVGRLLTDSKTYSIMAQAVNPYGDGRACERIVNVLAAELTANCTC
ncbi:MAG: UDP-N-acetylglucosamine 2-epimerase (non-hydrolyzing) [Phycisphaerales bacterium]|nr:UDP-N-acetylglucosamine 2-epimerase (non-hydrolyzing) [Phycisphaerales bacterium]